MREFRNTFILNLSSLMKERGITQTALARELSVDQTTISAWLRGESEPTLSKIQTLLTFFAISFEELVE